MRRRISRNYSAKMLLDSRTTLFCFSAIWIMLFHISGKVGFPSGNVFLTAVHTFLKYGNYGVDIFLILSAIGLYSSMEKHNVILFYKNRIRRILIPYLTVATLFFIWQDFFFLKDGIKEFLYNVSTINYWKTGDHPTWYIAFIIILYALFPAVYVLDKRTKHIGTVCLVFLAVIFELFCRKLNLGIYVNCERALSRIPVFLIGVLLAKYILSNARISKLLVPASVLIIIGIFGILFYDRYIDTVVQRYLGIPMALSLIILISFLEEYIKSKRCYSVITYIGKLSLEIYIVHVFLIRLFNAVSLWQYLPAYAWYFVIVFSTILMAYLLSLITHKY